MKNHARQAKTHQTPLPPESDKHDEGTEGPVSPYHPRWDPELQASFALGSIAVVEELLAHSDLTTDGVKTGAFYLLWWARDFLETLDLDDNAEEFLEAAARNRKTSAEAVRLLDLARSREAEKRKEGRA